MRQTNDGGRSLSLQSLNSVPGNQQEENMRKLLIAAVIAAGVSVVATAAWGSSKAPNRASSAGNDATALVKCGKTRSIGLMAPFTGPAASIGILQPHAQEEDQVRQRGHPARRRKRDGRSGQGCAGARLERQRSRRRRSGRLERGQGGYRCSQGSRSRLCLGLGDEHDDHDRRNPAGLLLPHRSAGLVAEQERQRLHHGHAQAEARLHHRRPGGLQHRPRGRGAGTAQGRRRDRRS
jgi:hypothetical protein